MSISKTISTSKWLVADIKLDAICAENFILKGNGIVSRYTWGNEKGAEKGERPNKKR
jgi:hypothetical protein